jgi:hypothetical protein
MSERLLKRISLANKIGLTAACLVTSLLLIRIPETFLWWARSRFSEALEKHTAQDELKRASISLLQSIDYTQGQTKGFFTIVLLFMFCCIALLIANLLVLRKLKRSLALNTMPNNALDRSAEQRTL